MQQRNEKNNNNNLLLSLSKNDLWWPLARDLWFDPGPFMTEAGRHARYFFVNQCEKCFSNLLGPLTLFVRFFFIHLVWFGLVWFNVVSHRLDRLAQKPIRCFVDWGWLGLNRCKRSTLQLVTITSFDSTWLAQDWIDRIKFHSKKSIFGDLFELAALILA